MHHWWPLRNVAVDESMVSTKARCSIKVFIPRKPEPNGIKIWTVADESPYIMEFEVFVRHQEKELTTNTLLRLVQRFPKSEVG
jgi:hypothetical protein